jgi:hypothetical protein
MTTSSTKYHVGAIECAESELPEIQKVLAIFPEIRGAVVHDGTKARYCLDLENLDSNKSKELVEQVQNMIATTLFHSRNK